LIVLDASIVVSWYFESERTPAKLAIMDRAIAEGAMVPAHWLTEVANALQMGVRRGRFDAGRLEESLNALAELAISREPSAFVSAVAAVLLASRHDLTVYDAAYLELALRQRLPLATLDRELAAAARREGVEVLP
jgi:predicted nucleic acid-binding protein